MSDLDKPDKLRLDRGYPVGEIAENVRLAQLVGQAAVLAHLEAGRAVYYREDGVLLEHNPDGRRYEVRPLGGDAIERLREVSPT